MSHTLLIVDDEPVILELLARVFQGEGYEIKTAANGREALEVLSDNEVSLIISDQRMPDMNGVDLLERAFRMRPEVVRFILTGYIDRDSTLGAINRGHAHQYFQKPWDSEELRLQTAKYLAELDMRRELSRLQALTATQNEQLRSQNERLEELVQARTIELQVKNNKLEEVNLRLESSYDNSIRILENILETCDPALGSHGIRVATHSLLLGKRLGLDDAYCDDIYVAGLLHDLTLIGVPSPILK